MLHEETAVYYCVRCHSNTNHQAIWTKAPSWLTSRSMKPREEDFALFVCMCVSRFLFMCNTKAGEVPALKSATPANNHTHLLLMILVIGSPWNRVAEVWDHWVTQSVNSGSLRWTCRSALSVRSELNCVLFCKQTRRESVEGAEHFYKYCWGSCFLYHGPRGEFTVRKLGDCNGGNHVIRTVFAHLCLFVHY